MAGVKLQSSYSYKHSPEFILSKIKAHMPSWSNVDAKDLDILLLSGCSNFSYRVEVKGMPQLEIKVLLFRVFDQELTDRRIEQAIFESQSENGQGPMLYFQCHDYRLEQFIPSRPLQIWEMRNPAVYSQIAEKLCHFNNTAGKAIEDILPMSKENTALYEVLNKWSTKLEAMLPQIYECLKASEADAETTAHRLQIVEGIEKNFLFDGYKEHFMKLMPDDEHFPYVCSHCDPQENNILMKQKMNLELVLIDIEYAGWNPMAFDLGCYLDECMSENDCKLTESGIGWFTENMPTQNEVEDMSKVYLTSYFTKFMPDEQKEEYEGLDDYLQKKVPIFVRQVNACMLLDSMRWAVWGVALLEPTVESCAPPTDEGFMNYAVSEACLVRYEFVQKSLGKDYFMSEQDKMQRCLMSAPEGGEDGPSERSINLWKLMKPRGVDFWQKYWDIVGEEAPLFDDNSKYEEWEEEDGDGYTYLYNAMRDRETGKPNGIVRCWRRDGFIWEYTMKQGVYQGMCLRIGFEPHTYFQLYDISEQGGQHNDDWFYVNEEEGTIPDRIDDRSGRLAEITAEDMLADA